MLVLLSLGLLDWNRVSQGRNDRLCRGLFCFGGSHIIHTRSHTQHHYSGVRCLVRNKRYLDSHYCGRFPRAAYSMSHDEQGRDSE